MNQMVASYSASKIMTFDLETGQSVVDLDSGSMYGQSPLIIVSAHFSNPQLLLFSFSQMALAKPRLIK